MAKRLFIIVVLLLLGTVVNVAVAWGFALRGTPSWPDEKMGGLYEWSADGHYWQVVLFQRAGSTELFSARFLPAGGHMMMTGMNRVESSSIPYWSRFHQQPREEELQEFRTVWHEYVYGWPMLSMGLLTENDHQIRDGSGALLNQPRPDRTLRGIVLTPSTPIVRRWANIPLGVIWPGFVGNAGLYSAILALLAYAGRTLRRSVRRRRGRCLECGYPAGASPVCTECGGARLCTRRIVRCPVNRQKAGDRFVLSGTLGFPL